MIVLGIGGILGHGAAALVKDGELAAAIEQSKLVRRTTRGELPMEAIGGCLAIAGASPGDVDTVAIVRPLSPNFHLQLRSVFPGSRVVLVEHQTAHAASAFLASPFDEASVLTLDRGGDIRCGSLWKAAGNSMALEKEMFYPDSLGDLYGRVTELLGFRSSADEHKVQWLSASGDSRFRDLFAGIMPLDREGWPRIDRSYFDASRLAAGGFSAKFYAGLDLAAGAPVPEELRAHVAAGIQRATEDVTAALAGTGRNLCFAGGLALNALLVASLERSPNFESVFVQPAAGNAGTAIGAVLYAWHTALGNRERVRIPNMSLGPAFGAAEIKQVLENCKLGFRYLLTTDDLIGHAVRLLGEGKIVAWMQDRMEFGPRALGNRSLLASPLDPYSAENLNAFIKHREAFRKFAASAPAEVAAEYFETGPNARFLATAGRVRPAHAATFASAILGKDTIRVHTVTREDNPLYWRLLHAAGEATGLPVLYNTSFNLFGDPLVCTPRDAVRSFYSSGIDAMFTGNFMLEK
jgi:carbamoyltransferase